MTNPQMLLERRTCTQHTDWFLTLFKDTIPTTHCNKSVFSPLNTDFVLYSEISIGNMSFLAMSHYSDMVIHMVILFSIVILNLPLGVREIY